jgi:hypothetical protein
MSIIDNLLNWEKASWKNKLLIGVPFALAVLGWLYYDRNQEATSMHAKMITMCGADAACVAAVDQFSEVCFKDNYSISRRHSGVRTADFVNCVNEKSGVQHFSVAKD